MMICMGNIGQLIFGDQIMREALFIWKKKSFPIKIFMESKSQRPEPSHNNDPPLLFPRHAKSKDRLPEEEMRKTLSQQCLSVFGQSLEQVYEMDLNVIESLFGKTVYRFQCKQCKANFVMTFFKSQCEYVSEMNQHHHVNIRSVLKSSYIYTMKKPATKLDEGFNFSRFLTFLRQANYKVIYEDAHLPISRQTLIFASPLMISAYKKFGDHLCFTQIHPSEINKSNNIQIMLSIFSVQDTNLRALPVGVALYNHQNLYVVEQVFLRFFRLHLKQPDSIEIGGQLIIGSALNSLKQRNLFKGFVFVNPNIICKSFQNDNCETKWPRKILQSQKRLLQNAIFTRNDDDFQKIKKQILFIKSRKNRNHSYFSQLLNEQFFYIKSPKVFVGLYSFNSAKKKELLQLFSKQETTIQESVFNFPKFQRQYFKNLSTIKHFSEPIQQVLNDPKIKSLRHCLQNIVFSRFLQNYAISMQKYSYQNQSIDKTLQQKHFRIINKQTQKIINLIDWCCDCGEYQRTGIPCPHVITVARAVKEKPYEQLIKRRWLCDKPS